MNSAISLTPDRPEPAPAVSIEQPYSWLVVALGLLIASLIFGAATSIPILLKPMVESLGSTTRSLSLVHASFMMGAGFGGLVWGRLLDRWGFFPIGMVAAAATACGLLITSITSHIPVLYLAYGVLIGFCGQGILFSPLIAAASQWFDRRRPLAIAITASGQGVGGFLFPPLLRWNAEFMGWRPTLAIYGIVAGLTIAACTCVFRRTPPRLPTVLQTGHTHRFTKQFSRGSFASFALSLGLANLATFMIIGHLTAAGEELGFTPIAAASLISIMLGTSLISRLSSGYLCHILGPYRLLVIALILHAVGVLWLSIASGFVFIAVGAALTGLGFGAYLPGYAVLVRAGFPAHESGRRIGEVYFLGFMASGAGTWAGGWLHDLEGNYAYVFFSAAVSAFFSVVVLLGLWKTLNKVT